MNVKIKIKIYTHTNRSLFKYKYMFLLENCSRREQKKRNKFMIFFSPQPVPNLHSSANYYVDMNYWKQ